MGRINIDAITPGMVLAEDLRHSNGRFLLGKGVDLDETRLRILRMWGIHSVEVQGNPDDVESSQAEEVDPAVLKAAERQVAERFFDGALNHPFLKELFRVCALRKAREIARQQPPVRDAIFSSLEQAPVSEQGVALLSFKGQIDLQALVDRETGLASLPNVFIEISRVIGDPRSSAVHVAEVIHLFFDER